MGISFPFWYPEIQELIRRRALHTGMARSIVRKGGFVLGSASGDEVGTQILALPPVKLAALSQGIYFHPADLPHYITYRSLEFASEVRVNASVTAMTPTDVEPNATLSAVYATTLPDFSPLATGGSVSVNFTTTGFYASEWETIPEEARMGEVYIGMSLQAHTAIGALWMGQSEIRIR